MGLKPVQAIQQVPVSGKYQRKTKRKQMSTFVGVEEGLVPEKQQTFSVTGHPYSEHRLEKGKYGQEIKTGFF